MGHRRDEAKGVMAWLSKGIDCLGLLVAAVVFAAEGLRLMARPLDPGIKAERIGPGTWMLGVGILIAILLAGAELFGRFRIAQGLRQSSEEVAGTITVKSWLLMMGCVAAIPLVGFTAAIGLFALVYMLWVENQRVLTGLVVSAVLVGTYYLVFVRLAKVVFPRGVLGF